MRFIEQMCGCLLLLSNIVDIDKHGKMTLSTTMTHPFGNLLDGPS